MRITRGFAAAIVAIVLAVGIVGLATVRRLEISAEDSAIAEAGDVARMIADLVAHVQLGGGTNSLSGGAGLERSSADLQRALDRIAAIRARDIAIVDVNGRIIADANHAAIGKPVAADPDGAIARTMKDGIARTLVEARPDQESPTREIVVALRAQDGSIVGALTFGFSPSYDRLAGLAHELLYVVVAAIVLGWLVAAGTGEYFARRLTRPLQRLRAAAVEMAHGNLGVRVEITSHDELGELAGAFNALTQSLQESHAGESRSLTELARSSQALRSAAADRQRATQELQESELRFRQLAENIREVFFLVSADSSQMLYVSPAYEEVWGRSCASVYADPRSWMEAVHPDDLEAVRRSNQLRSKTGSVDYQYRIQRPDGAVRWIRARGFPIRNEGGEIYRIAGVCEDITERVQMTGVLAEHESGLRRAQTMAKLGHIITRPDGSFESWSHSMTPLLGRDHRDMPRTTRDWLELVHPDDRAAMRESAIDSSTRGTHVEVEYRIRRADGEWIHVRHVMEPIAGPADAAGHTRWFNSIQDVTGQKRVVEELRESERRFSDMLGNVELISLMVDREAQITYANDYLLRLTGWRREEVLGHNWFDLFVPAEMLHLKDVHAGVLAGLPSARHHKSEIRTRSGERRLIRWSNSALRSPSGGVIGAASIGEDITERERADHRIKRLNRVYAVLSGINALIVRAQDREELFQETCRIAVDEGAFRMAWIGTVDPETLDGRVVAISGGEATYAEQIRFTARPGTPDSEGPASVTAREKRVVICNDVSTDPSLAELREPLLAAGHRATATFPLIVGDRAVAVLALFAGEVDFFDSDEMKLLLELAWDIAFALDHLNKVEELDYLAYYDALTGLANRNLMQDRLRQAIANATRQGDMVTVAFLDLDHFKDVNDSLGHNVGDELLRRVAARLKTTVRESDTVTRMGGDEFVVVLPSQAVGASVPGGVRGSGDDLPLEVRISDLMQRILGNISQSMVLSERELSVTCSIGLSVYPQDGADAEALLRNADAAMYRAKELGRNNFQFFTADMHDRVRRRMDLESGLKLALERDEFELHYQPEVDLRSGKIIGAEALLRWRHPQKGLIGPGEFIELAEESGLIIPIGEWVLARACAQNKAWQDQGLPHIVVAVNLSARQCAQQDIETTVRTVLQATRLPPQCLELELTESNSMANPERIVTLMERLKAMGVELSIDDFGTGYSSMSYLKRFPVDKLKLDMSFVREITTDPNNLAISEAIITLAHSLRLQVIAEGVETEGQLTLLAARDCDQIQGFFFSRPVPSDEFANILREDRRLAAGLIGQPEAEPALLIVDDDPNVIALFQSILAPTDYELLLTTSVADAFELLARREVAVVLCDQRMPTMSGVEFFRNVRSMYPNVTRVLMSAYEDFEATREAINRGAVHKFLGKPWEHDELKTLLEEGFETYRRAARRHEAGRES